MLDCYIIGCGPNGEKGYKLVPQYDAKIVLNSAILLVDEFQWANWIWMVSDNKIVEQPWFADAYELYAHRLHGSAQVAERVKVAYEWQENPWMTIGNVKPIEGVFRGAASVGGCALHRCHWTAHRPILCGIDMGGWNTLTGHLYVDAHWDNKINMLNQLIKNHIPQTRTLTETKLDVEDL